MTYPYHPLPPTPDTSGQFRRVEAAPRRRRAWPWILAAVVVLVLVAGGVAWAVLAFVSG